MSLNQGATMALVKTMLKAAGDEEFRNHVSRYDE